MWIYAAFIFLLPEVWSRETGYNQSMLVNNNTSLRSDGVRSKLFNLGNDVKLTCNDMTMNLTLYIIWKIDLKNKICKIAFSFSREDENSCNDGKSLQNTSTGHSFLHIPNFSAEDQGSYVCETAFHGNSEIYEINVAVITTPTISLWLEQRDNKKVAVCKAEGGRPAANISWSTTSNSTTVETLLDSDGFFDVESRLELLEGVDLENLSCSISHPYWPEEQFLFLKDQKASVSWTLFLIMVPIFALLTGLFFFARKHILRPCQQSNTSPSKSATKEDVEDVESGASYVQRENSIYNLSADSFP